MRTIGAQAALCCEVEHPAKSPVVPLGSSKVARDAAGVARNRYEAGVRGEVAGGGKPVQRPTGLDEEPVPSRAPMPGTDSSARAYLCWRNKSWICSSTSLVSLSMARSRPAIRLTSAAVTSSPATTHVCRCAAASAAVTTVLRRSLRTPRPAAVR